MPVAPPAPPVVPSDVPPETLPRLRALAARWGAAGPAERANYQLYLIELCDALGVERPRPAAGDADAATAYQFEFPVRVVGRDGQGTTNFVDLYRAGAFVLEAKDAAREAAGAEGTTRLLTRAWGQAVNYARDLPERPPYVLVLDVGATLLAWDRWSGSYGGFHAARRIDLRTLADRPDDVAFLRDVWTDPSRRDPRRHAQRVTERIAGVLGRLAAQLEGAGHEPERVARFLIRCVFTMFAEDVRLLPDETFRRLLSALRDETPAAFVQAAEALWAAMDAGALFGYHRLLRFNGHFFREPDGGPARALPLGTEERRLLLEAAEADWAHVEPSIFGTLLVRALTPEERHRLGAEYTPRAFIERLVRPTVEEPVRARWTAVQAEVLQLRERGRPADVRAAERALLDFHGWLRSLRVLDPACGSGNFLYVTMHALKRVELEVFRSLAELHGGQLGMRLAEIDPGQFHGIEVKPWAREIAELTLWIGFHQFWRQAHGDVQPDEPLLRDTGTLACRDAVLAWDGVRHVPERDRPDPTPRVVHPVTGQLVPDPEARLRYVEHVNARAAEWPEAEFIVGNPPFMGQFRQREALGDGYVDALRAAYPDVPDAADYVMYWVRHAARAVASGRTLRAGLITTQSVTQVQNRQVLVQAAERGVRAEWAIADHYWNDGSDDARVRVAMFVLARNPSSATLVSVDGNANEVGRVQISTLNADLSAHADVPTAAAVALGSNAGLCSRGFMLFGAGFVLERGAAEEMIVADPRNRDIVRPFLNGKDLTTRPRGVSVIDFGTRGEAGAREYSMLFDLVRTLVKPERDANADRSARTRWWSFGRNRDELRAATAGLARYIVTPETSKHRFFVFLAAEVAADNALVCIASSDAFVLGVVSSEAHRVWALAAGSQLGIDGTPRYNKGPCFEAFPFPDPAPNARATIAELAERLDAHRKAALARDERVTMTGMYNVVAKLRAGDPLTAKERDLHTLAACGVLRDLHDALDAAVAAAYGWPWPLDRDAILDRLVALHAERVAEERAGRVRWLRPDYQNPAGRGADAPAAHVAPDASPDTASDRAAAPSIDAPAVRAPWPATAAEQIGALARHVAARPGAAADVAAAFDGAPPALVARHLETLALLGELRVDAAGRYAPPVATV